MFARFRLSATGRLNVSIVEARRVNGSVKQEHIACLGSVETPPSVRTRIGFWQQLDERLVQLSNRLSAADAAKVRNSIHERIPQPTDDEIAADRAKGIPQPTDDEIAADRAKAVTDELDGWENLKSGYQDLINLASQRVEIGEQDVAADKGLAATSQELKNDIDGIQSGIAKGSVTVEQSAATRRKATCHLLTAFAGTAKTRRR
jgi:hypothetical protein